MVAKFIFIIGLIFCVGCKTALPGLYRSGDVVIYNQQLYRVIKYDSEFKEYKIKLINCKGTLCHAYVLENQIIPK